MARRRVVRKPEDLADIPPDQEVDVVIDEPAADAPVVVAPDETKKEEAAPAVQPEPPPQEPEPPEISALQKQIEELKKSQAADAARWNEAIKAREAAEKRVRELEENSATTQKSMIENLIIDKANAMLDCDNRIELAQRAEEAAEQTGDTAAKLAARQKWADAHYDKRDFERQKAELERQKAELEKQPQPSARAQNQPATVEQYIDQMPNLIPSERDWLKQHPDALTDQRKSNRLAVAYDDAMEQGLQRGTATYFQFIEERLGYRKPPPPQEYEGEEDNEPAPPPAPTRRVTVAAPVSREAPSPSTGRPASSNRITLTPAQREHARIAGVSDIEYAKGVRELQRLKQLDPEKYR